MNYKNCLLQACCLLLVAIGVNSYAADIQMMPLVKKPATTGIYIVQLREDPVIAYQGEIYGYAATKPAKGQKIDRESDNVRRYVAHLEAMQDQAIHSVGGSKVYNYSYSFNGFAARMTDDDANELRGRSDVVNVWKDEIRQIQTDTSPAYIGLTRGGGAWSKGLTGEDIVIGSIDTGIWPEHPSFADVKTHKKGNKGKKIPYGPIPAGFTPSGCDFGNVAVNPLDDPFTCNNKLVSARCYNLGFSSVLDPANPCGGDGVFAGPTEFQSARDNDGHGSHTASTAGGNNEVAADIGGEFLGKVSGMAPRARIAAYKVCWEGGCASSDSAAAIDQAVADGVDVINFSIGGPSNSFATPDDIAFLFAADAGVFVATSNGNDGPGAQTVGTPSGVPWITAVGANQDDQVFNLTISVDAPAGIAGDKVALEGAGPVALADTGTISDDVTLTDPADGCSIPSDPPPPPGLNTPISGIALTIRGGCSFDEKYNNAAAAGASALIVYNDGTTPARIDPIVMSAPGVTIPGVMVGFNDGDDMAGAMSVAATMDPVSAVSADNRVAGFSSRGPNGGALDVIKPDLSAPGVNILAAETGSDGELFQIISGTSMASPHVAGAFALLKQAHPDWSPAQARSALMTTARQDLNKTFGDAPADAFDIGAGAIIPTNAIKPHLTYDVGILDYLAFSCDNNVQLISDGFCAFLEGEGFPTDGSDLNLPSIGIGELVGIQTITRTVTSVSKGKKRFKVSVDEPPGVKVSVSPSTIKLRNGESATYEVTFTATSEAVPGEWVFGSLTWSHSGRKNDKSHKGRKGRKSDKSDKSDKSGKRHKRRNHSHSVRSPIAVRPVALSAPARVGGTGTDGTLSYEIAFGYNGPFSATMDGLSEGGSTPGAVLDADADLHFEQFVPAGTTLARFSLFDEEIGASNDLDLQVFGPASAGFPFVCQSGTATSEEQCDLVNPAPGEYAVFVIDFASAPGPTPYQLWLFNLDGNDAGNTTVTAPASATVGNTGQVDVDWSGINAGTRALGIINYDDGVEALSGTTEVMINTQ